MRGVSDFSESIVARLLSRSRARVFTGNSFTRQWLISSGLNPATVALTSQAPAVEETVLPYDQAMQLEPALKSVQGETFVLFIARLSHLKGAGDLPAIVQYVLKACPETRFVICGSEGPESASVRRTLKAFEQAGRVIFLGFVSEPIKAWLLHNAHTLIAPSYEEGWGGVVAEGLWCGCWVVTYELPAVRESSPRGPVFVPLGDVTSFSQATVASLLRTRPSRMAWHSAQGWEWIARRDLEIIVSAETLRGQPAP
jgi:glycosyltransferase involved in cell wall biosynthesis